MSDTEKPLSCRILVIDDNRLAARTMQMFLEEKGHSVELANTGLQGIEAARRLRPEVVVCDIGLPELDGYSVARQLRQEPSLANVRLIAIWG